MNDFYDADDQKVEKQVRNKLSLNGFLGIMYVLIMYR